MMLRRAAASGALIAVGFLMAGCPTVRFGREPATARLVTDLVPHVSKKADVLRVLGRPRGGGAVQLHATEPRHETWFYERIEARLSGEATIKFLLVYFDDDVFAGYFWFSSLAGAPSLLQR